MESGKSGQIMFGWQQKESTFPLTKVAASKVKSCVNLSLGVFESHLLLSKLINKKIHIFC